MLWPEIEKSQVLTMFYRKVKEKVAISLSTVSTGEEAANVISLLATRPYYYKGCISIEMDTRAALKTTSAPDKSQIKRGREMVMLSIKSSGYERWRPRQLINSRAGT